MAYLDKKTGYFVSQLSSLRDPVRSHLFQLVLTRNKSEYTTEDDKFFLLVKTAEIPQIETTTESVHYMGFEKEIPTGFKYSRESVFEIQETSDMVGLRLLTAWNQAVLNSDLLYEESLVNPNSAMFKRGGVSSEFINLYGAELRVFDYSTGNIILTVAYQNFWPKIIKSNNMSYNEAKFLQYTVTFSHDKYKILYPESNNSKINNNGSYINTGTKNASTVLTYYKNGEE